MKKFLAIVLALTLILGLCACGGSGNAGTNNGGSGDSASTGDKVKLSIGLPSDAMVLDHKNNALTKWIEEKCNVELTFVEFSGGTDLATQISTTIAARQELPDILYGISLGESVRNRYGREGYLLDLSDYYADKEGASKIFWDRMENELSEYDQDMVLRTITDAETGGIYSVPTVETALIDTMKFQGWINQTWLDKLNLKAPTNNEELVTVLKAFRDQDPNGNGLKDEIPLYGSQNASRGAQVIDWLVNLFCYYNPARTMNVGEDGKLYPVLTSDEYREALKFINMLYKEGMLSTLAWTSSNQEMKQIITPLNGTPLCGIFFGNLTLCTAYGNEIMYQYVPLQTWGNAIRTDTSISQTTFITEDCDEEKRDRAFEMLMTMWTWDGSMRIRYGEYGVNWTDADPGAKSEIGLDATYKILSDPMKEQNTAKWSKIASTFNAYAEGETAQMDDNMDEWMRRKYELHAESYHLFAEAEEKWTDNDAKCPLLKYTDEEKERSAVAEANVGDRMNRAITEFMTGVLDPNSDAAWEAHLKQIDELGMQTVLEKAQIAYDRDN